MLEGPSIVLLREDIAHFASGTLHRTFRCALCQKPYLPD